MQDFEIYKTVELRRMFRFYRRSPQNGQARALCRSLLVFLRVRTFKESLPC